MNRGTELGQRCEAAFQEGLNIDLTGCFHEVTGPYAYQPCNYYPLLAGLARALQMTQVSISAPATGDRSCRSARGLSADLGNRAALVTVDIVELGAVDWQRFPNITRIRGDSTSLATVETVRRRFRPPIDMVYLDAVHSLEHTTANIDADGA